MSGLRNLNNRGHMNNKKNEVRKERQQQRIDSGLVETHFPEVSSIVINMKYSQKGVLKPLPRIVNFFPSSYALFRIDCLRKDCVEGGFDLNKVITTMIKKRRETAKGELCCEGDGSSTSHSEIAYEVAVQYSK
jgi:hypothetical protein